MIFYQSWCPFDQRNIYIYYCLIYFNASEFMHIDSEVEFQVSEQL